MFLINLREVLEKRPAKCAIERSRYLRVPTLQGYRGGRGIIYGRRRGDRDRNDRRTKLVRWCEATAIGRGICGDFGYKRTTLSPEVSGSPFRPKGYQCALIVDTRLMDVAPTQVAWNRGRATGTSTSATSCTRLLHHFARRAAGVGGGGRSRSAYRDERERNDLNASEDNRTACRLNREEATGTWNRSATVHSIDYRDRRSINYLARSQARQDGP